MYSIDPAKNIRRIHRIQRKRNWYLAGKVQAGGIKWAQSLLREVAETPDS